MIMGLSLQVNRLGNSFKKNTAKKVSYTLNDPTEFWMWIGKIALVGVVIVAVYTALNATFPTLMQSWFNKLSFTTFNT